MLRTARASFAKLCSIFYNAIKRLRFPNSYRHLQWISKRARWSIEGTVVVLTLYTVNTSESSKAVILCRPMNLNESMKWKPYRPIGEAATNPSPFGNSRTKGKKVERWLAFMPRIYNVFCTMNEPFWEMNDCTANPLTGPPNPR